MEKPNRNWASKREKKAQRLEKISNLLNGKYVETEKTMKRGIVNEYGYFS